MLSAGIDLGTSGVRAAVLDTEQRRVVAHAALPLPDGERTADGGHLIDDAAVIDAALRALADVAPAAGRIDALSVVGTAGTLCFRDCDGIACAAAVAYDDSRFGGGLERVAAWRERVPRAVRVVPITDAVLEALGAEPGHTDWTNALKLGWDPRGLRWPGSALDLERDGFLPRVAAPGTRAGRSAGPAAHLALGSRSVLARGATDSCAMHIAAAGLTPGAWSVSLGSTITWKAAIAGAEPPATLDRLPPGSYAHRIAPDRWLAAAASNCGGAVLRALEPGADLAARDREADVPSGFAAYPLARPGERYPVADAGFAGFGLPHPSDPRLHAALLEGAAFVIRRGVERLNGAGVAPPAALHVTGGGARSAVWTGVIAAVLGRPLIVAPDAGPALGAALLAAAAADGLPLTAIAAAAHTAGAQSLPLSGSHIAAQLGSAYQRFSDSVIATTS